MRRLTSLANINPDINLMAGIDITGNFKELFSTPVQMPGCLFLLCLRGHCTINLHLSTYEMQADSIAAIFPQQFFQIAHSSHDCRFMFVAFSKDIANSSTIFSRAVELIPYVYDRPVIPLSPAMSDFMASLINLMIKGKRIREQFMMKGQSPSAFYQIILCLANINMNETGRTKPRHEYTRNQEILKELARQIINNYKQERGVAFYADKLHLSAQHLSTTVKKTTGKTLTDVISTFVINDAQGKLKSTDMTIQEIAYSLNFSDISFFGKYFKRYTGMSPKQYRNTLEE